MHINFYQHQALRTWNKTDDEEKNLAVGALGLVGEAGEFSELVKKWIGHGHKLDKEQCLHELGDVLWYIAICSHELGFSLQDIAETNVEKLKRRYPSGFSEEISKSRYQG